MSAYETAEPWVWLPPDDPYPSWDDLVEEEDNDG